MTGAAVIPQEADRENLRLLTQLRWIAAAGQVVTIAVVHGLMKAVLPLDGMLAALCVLVGWNLMSILRVRRAASIRNGELFVNLLVDVLVLTVQLYLSGGAANPFVFLFLLQVILGGVVLHMRWAVLLGAVTVAAFALLTVLGRPLVMPHPHQADFFDLHIAGMFLCFVLTAGLLLLFLARIAAGQRQRDRRLAQLRQRAVEEDHVVRMGLLAAGAAHELGTPLSTLSVILNDWRRLPLVQGDAEAQAELETMHAALDRCKAIVSGILMSSGQLRGEGTVRTTVRRFLDDLVQEWRGSRGPSHLTYENLFAPDAPMVSDAALAQVAANLLDNALEAAPCGRIVMVARRDSDRLVIEVRDDGPGFDAGVLKRIGSPYVTTRSRPGGGLGLFLVVNVVRKLGGEVMADNPAAGGARVVVRLPLSALGAPS